VRILCQDGLQLGAQGTAGGDFDIAMPLFETQDVRTALPSAITALKEGRPRPTIAFQNR
jgi:hypothetical protein